MSPYAASPRRGRLGRKALIILALFLVGAAAGGAVVYRHYRAEPPAEEGDHPEPEPPAGEPQVVDLGEFLVNVDSGSGLRYLRAQVAVEILVPEEELSGHAKGGHGKEEGFALPPEQLLRAKDVVVRELTASRFEMLRTPGGRRELRDRLAEALGAELAERQVAQVLLVAFVMQ